MVFATTYLIRDLYPEYIKNFYHSTRAHNPIEMGAKDPDRHFPKDMQMVSKHGERCLASWVIREMQIKPWGHGTSTTMAVMNKTGGGASARLQGLEPPTHRGWDARGCGHIGNQSSSFSKCSTRSYLMPQRSPGSVHEMD